ncbi:unnamed protein product [Citrullus colocynthis]|uniref:Uncharacterized protein n=1 Tax=Citrullus colocynthis TaxID=252529 RepID=A0ABP0XYK0_9ROSI
MGCGGKSFGMDFKSTDLWDKWDYERSKLPLTIATSTMDDGYDFGRWLRLRMAAPILDGDGKSNVSYDFGYTSGVNFYF